MQFDLRLIMHAGVERAVGYAYHALVALKHHLLAVIKPHRGHGGIGELALWPGHHAGHLRPDINVIFAANAALQFNRFSAHHKAHRAIIVNANVANAAAARIGAVADIAKIRAVVIGKRCIDIGDVANSTLFHQLLGAQPLGMKDDHVSLCRQFLGGVAGGDDLVNLVRFHGDGLFGQHMLASGQGFQRPFDVQMVGQGDIDGFHLGVGQQSFVAGMYL